MPTLFWFKSAKVPVGAWLCWTSQYLITNTARADVARSPGISTSATGSRIPFLFISSSNLVTCPLSSFHSSPSLATGLLLLLLCLLPPPPPPALPPPRPPFPGGGRTNAKSTTIAWSSSLVSWAPSMAARASSSVAYSIKAYP